MTIKYGGSFFVTDEALARRESAPMTQEQRAAINKWMIQVKREDERYTNRLLAALSAVTDPILKAVIKHHRDEDGYCYGCGNGDADGYPCSTLDIIGEQLGVEGPSAIEFPVV